MGVSGTRPTGCGQSCPFRSSGSWVAEEAAEGGEPTATESSTMLGKATEHERASFFIRDFYSFHRTTLGPGFKADKAQG